MHVESAAIAPRRLVFDRRFGTVGRPRLNRVEPQRLVLEIEEVVRHRGVHGHPHIVARQYGRRGQHPLPVRAGRNRGQRRGGDGGGQTQKDILHVPCPFVNQRQDTETAPHSVFPAAPPPAPPSSR